MVHRQPLAPHHNKCHSVLVLVGFAGVRLAPLRLGVRGWTKGIQGRGDNPAREGRRGMTGNQQAGGRVADPGRGREKAPPLGPEEARDPARQGGGQGRGKRIGEDRSSRRKQRRRRAKERNSKKQSQQEGKLRKGSQERAQIRKNSMESQPERATNTKRSEETRHEGQDSRKKRGQGRRAGGRKQHRRGGKGRGWRDTKARRGEAGKLLGSSGTGKGRRIRFRRGPPSHLRGQGRRYPGLGRPSRVRAA